MSKQKKSGRNVSFPASPPPTIRWPQQTGLNLALLGLFTLIVFRPVWMSPAEMLWASDLVRAHSAFKQVQWHNFWGWGQFPLWDPTAFGGKSIVGDPLPALLNPASLLFWLFDSPVLFGFVFTGKVALSACGMYLLARRRGCEAQGALLAAMIFAFSGKVAAHLYAGHLELLSTVLGLPWALWALERLLANKRCTDVFLLGGALALIATNGSVQMMYWNCLFLGCYFLCRLYEEGLSWRGPWPWGDVGRFSAAIGAFALLGAAWWLPIIRQTLLLSARRGEINYEFSTMNSLQPAELARFIWPFFRSERPALFASDPQLGFFWESASYPGLIALVLGVACAVTFWRDRGIRCLALLTLAITFLALGENSPLYWLAYNIVPGFSLFRAPARLLFYAILPLALLAGLGLTRAEQNPFRVVALLAGLVLVQLTLIGMLALQSGPVPQINGGGWFALLMAVLLLCMAAGAYLDLISVRLWQLSCIALLALELAAVWRPHLIMTPIERVFPASPVAEYLRKQRGIAPFRVLDTTGLLEQQRAAQYGLEIIDGYHPGIYGHYLDFYKKIWSTDRSSIVQVFTQEAAESDCPTVLDRLNVEYVVTHQTIEIPNYEKAYEYTPRGTDHTVRVYRRLNALPRAYLCGRAEVPPNGTALLDHLCKVNPREACLVENAPVSGSVAYTPLELRRWAPGTLEVPISAQGDGMLVIAETWHPDWRATLDGAPVAVRRVNHAQLGIAIPAGAHEVRVWYSPWDFYLGIAASAAGLLAWGVLLILGVIRRPGTASPTLPTAC